MSAEDREPTSLASKARIVAKELSDTLDLSRRSFLTAAGATVTAALAA